MQWNYYYQGYLPSSPDHHLSRPHDFSSLYDQIMTKLDLPSDDDGGGGGGGGGGGCVITVEVRVILVEAPHYPEVSSSYQSASTAARPQEGDSQRYHPDNT